MMLAKGDGDAITGFYFTSLLNLNARVDPNAVWNASFLPAKAELNVFTK